MKKKKIRQKVLKKKIRQKVLKNKIRQKVLKKKIRQKVLKKKIRQKVLKKKRIKYLEKKIKFKKRKKTISYTPLIVHKGHYHIEKVNIGEQKQDSQKVGRRKIIYLRYRSNRDRKIILNKLSERFDISNFRSCEISPHTYSTFFFIDKSDKVFYKKAKEAGLI